MKQHSCVHCVEDTIVNGRDEHNNVWSSEASHHSCHLRNHSFLEASEALVKLCKSSLIMTFVVVIDEWYKKLVFWMVYVHTPCLQRVPVQPDSQMQLKWLMPSRQVPPLSQGFEMQSSISTEGKSTMYSMHDDHDISLGKYNFLKISWTNDYSLTSTKKKIIIWRCNYLLMEILGHN